ncbi:MAG: ABC transporter permease [Bacteroidota bacterium]
MSPAYFFAELKEGLSISFRAIRANKMRSVLTTLGIVIGIVSVTLMGTAIEGLNRAFNNSISALGADVLFVNKFPWFTSDDWFLFRNRKDLTVEHSRALERQSTLARAVSASVGWIANVKHREKTTENVFVNGATADYMSTSGATILQGRNMTIAEVDGNRPVCVIGFDVASNLFPGEDPIGKFVKIHGHTYRVVGTFDKMGSFLGMMNLDNRVVIPIGEFSRLFGGKRSVQINIKAASLQELDDTKEEIRGILRKARKVPPGTPDDFAINQQEMLTKAFSGIGVVVAAIGLFITGLSLFVGGIGIMNIMFVSVTERTKEIGIRKAIGARRKTILLQFLIESVVLCLLGGIIGLVIAFPLTFVVDQILPTAMPLSVVGISLLVSIVVGVTSGLLPAYRAAKLDPVEALRYE